MGTNDTVNPSAAEDPGNPIAGLPVLEVWKARKVVVFKRSMATGYAGVQNAVLFEANTRCFLDDAKEGVKDIIKTSEHPGPLWLTQPRPSYPEM